MLFTELKRHILARRFDFGYCIYGNDAYLRKSAEDMFKGIVTDFPELNVSVFVDETDAQKIVEACEILPMMSEYRLVLVYNFKGDASKLIKYASFPSPSTVLTFIYDSAIESIGKLLPKLTIVDCKKLDKEMLNKWIASHVVALGSKITVEGADTLIEYCNNDLSRISTECDKLIGFKNTETITKADVTALVTADNEYKMYFLTSAISKRENEKVAEVLNSFVLSGTKVSSLISLIYNHFRKMLYCAITPAYSDMAHDLEIDNPKALYAIQSQAQKFKPIKLKKVCDACHKADADYKSGKITEKMALETVIYTALNV